MSPSIFGCVVMGSVVLSIWSPSCVLYYAGSGVNSVQVVLSVLSSRSLSFVPLLYNIIIIINILHTKIVSLLRYWLYSVYLRNQYTLQVVIKPCFTWNNPLVILRIIILIYNYIPLSPCFDIIWLGIRLWVIVYSWVTSLNTKDLDQIFFSTHPFCIIPLKGPAEYWEVS